MLVFAQVQHLQIQANTNTNLQIKANTNTNLQIQACLTLSACLEHRQVAECEQRPFKERFNVTLYKPQFFPLRLYARLYVWILLSYSWKTKTNSSLKVKTFWWVGDWCQASKGKKALKGWNFMFNRIVTIFGHQGCHWHGHQEVLLLCCDNENVRQWKKLSRKVLRDICLVLVLLLKWGWQLGEHMSEQLFDQGWQKYRSYFSQILWIICRNTNQEGDKEGNVYQSNCLTKNFCSDFWDDSISACSLPHSKCKRLNISLFILSQPRFISSHTHAKKNNVISFQDF